MARVVDVVAVFAFVAGRAEAVEGVLLVLAGAAVFAGGGVAFVSVVEALFAHPAGGALADVFVGLVEAGGAGGRRGFLKKKTSEKENFKKFVFMIIE